MPEYVNQHGRKPGRGVRPLLLMPKVLGVAAYFGGTLAAAVLTCVTPVKSTEDAARLADVVSRVFIWSAVPGLLVAIIFGVLLFWQHRSAFAKMRWWRVKMLVLAVTIPAFHLFNSSRVGLLRKAATADDALRMLTELRLGLAAAVIGGAVVIILGRHKPRLGQKTWTVAEQRELKAKEAKP
jgi:uncharacterized membrane protein